MYNYDIKTNEVYIMYHDYAIAYNEGYAAYMSGTVFGDVSANPYTRNTEEYFGWKDGFEDAEQVVRDEEE